MAEEDGELGVVEGVAVLAVVHGGWDVGFEAEEVVGDAGGWGDDADVAGGEVCDEGGAAAMGLLLVEARPGAVVLRVDRGVDARWEAGEEFLFFVFGRDRGGGKGIQRSNSKRCRPSCKNRC